MNSSNDNRNVFKSNFKGKIKLNGVDILLPEKWEFSPSGDAALTRRIKATGEFYQLVHRRKNRLETLGLYAPAEVINSIRQTLETERANPAYQKKLDAGRRARAERQQEYEQEFTQAVCEFLNFAECYKSLETTLARAVSNHAVPVGSGSVARTARIPLNERAEAAVIAWMRHQTTFYDSMKIARIKGERREVRRQLAEQSRKVLERYRRGETFSLEFCPLYKAITSI